MTFWRFMDYSADGRNLVQEWYEVQGDKAKANFQYALKEIAVTQVLDEAPAFGRCVRPRHVGLFAVKFETIEDGNKRHFRVIGFWSLNPGELILVNGCRKNGRVTDPPNAFETVLDIQLSYYHEGRGMIYEHVL